MTIVVWTHGSSTADLRSDGGLERRRKIAEVKRGKPRPPHVREAMLKASLGRHPSEESRRKMSEAHRQRGTLVPGTIPWTKEEVELVRTLAPEEAARRTERSLSGVYKRRRKPRVSDGEARMKITLDAPVPPPCISKHRVGAINRGAYLP